MYIPVKPIGMIQYNNYQTMQHLSYIKKKTLPQSEGSTNNCE